jgi:hypothetical protein
VVVNVFDPSAVIGAQCRGTKSREAWHAAEWLTDLFEAVDGAMTLS